MTVVTIAGPPFRASTPRVGFPYMLPLTKTPPPEWAQEFEGQDWASVDPRLRPPHHPRLEADHVWLPSVADPGDLRDLLDAVTAQIEEVDRTYEDWVKAHDARAAAAAREAAERRAREDAALQDWASSRPRRPTDP
jgi:hypothetical protein